jgi:tetratricopeptide (TPR) repeat protein
MKCLEKDRSRRYETANGLARDVERYLADESVEACPPSSGYRLRKLVRRYRGPVVAASIIFLLLVGGIAGTTWGLIRAERSRKQAQERLRQVEKGSEILASVFRDLDPISEEKEGKELRAILGDRLTQAAEELEGGGVGDPLLVANLQNRLGLSLLNLGWAKRAIPLLEKARATRATGLGVDHPDTLDSMSNLASCYQTAAQRDQALPLLEKTLELRRARLGPDHPDTLTSMHNLAFGYHADGQRDRALRLYEETLKLRQARLGLDHPNTLDTMNSLGVGYTDAGDLDRALPLLEKTLELRRARQGPDHLVTLNSMNNLAEVYKAAGDLGRALPLLEETFKLTRAKVGPDHPDTLVSMNNLAAGYRADGKLDRALPLYEETLKRRRARLGPDHADTLTSMNNLAEGYQAAGQLDRALPLLEETLKLMRAKLAPDHPNTLGSMNNLAAGYRAAGQLDRALPLLEETLKLFRVRLRPDHPNTLIVMNNLGEGYKAAGQLDRALPLLREAATGVEKQRFNHPRAGQILNSLIGLQEQLKRFDEAEAWRRKRVAVVKERRGAGSLEYAAELSALGANLLQQEKWTDAEPVLRESLALREKREPGAWATHSTRSLVGGALLGQKQYAEAEPLLVQGYEGLKARAATIPPAARSRLTEAAVRLVRLYEAWGKPEQAAAWKAKLGLADLPADVFAKP